ncbi:MAG: rod shape-determining protein MreD [Chloroflexota bacterium]|nr:rod shape-determining protein MreD [Chloroflexota bacterium]MDE3193576.1 rod shape-determining protein MreD [Chloroflexota bacterium]
MRIALALVVPVVAALIQGAVASLITVGGAFPSMPVLVAASWSIATGAREGLWWAFVGGLATDVLSAGPLGAFTVALLPGALIVGLGERSTSKPVPVLASVLGVGVAALLTQGIYLGLLAFLGHPLPAPALVAAETLGVAIYTAALAVVAYPLARIVRRLTEQESPF